MDKEQWQAIKNKDSSYDDSFVYVLKSTGVICRPSCEKAVNSPKNIIIFNTLEEALEAGFRPCKRCRPDQPGWKGAKKELSDALEREIKENYNRDFSLDELAQKLHINKYYMLRTFREVTGETPLQYHNRYRCEKAKELLCGTELPISHIAYEMGFNSASHFSRVFSKVMNMTPSECRKAHLRSLL